MHDTQMTSIEFCFLTKYSIINFTDAEERFFILSFFVITSDIFTVFCFFQIDLFL